MERFIPLVEDNDLRQKLVSAIDGKGAFRRFKDVLMGHVTERERWFAFRSERLRVFMEAWLSAHSLQPVARPAAPPEEPEPVEPPTCDDGVIGGLSTCARFGSAPASTQGGCGLPRRARSRKGSRVR